jgi:hypothetical protein
MMLKSSNKTMENVEVQKPLELVAVTTYVKGPQCWPLSERPSATGYSFILYMVIRILNIENSPNQDTMRKRRCSMGPEAVLCRVYIHRCIIAQ